MTTPKVSKMTYKDKLAVWTSAISFALGWILVVVNFLIPPVGTVADTTLYILAQALLYCGGVIGITQYTRGEMNKIKRKIGITDDDD